MASKYQRWEKAEKDIENETAETIASGTGYSWEDAKQDAKNAKKYRDTSWKRGDFEAMVDLAIAYFEEMSLIGTPHNLTWGGPYGEYRYKRQYEKKETMVKGTNDFCRFMRRVVWHPSLLRLIEKTTEESRGIGSPYNVFDYWRCSSNYTPKKAAKYLAKVRTLANEQLKNAGFVVSYQSLAQLLNQPAMPVEEAALWAAAETVNSLIQRKVGYYHLINGDSKEVVKKARGIKSLLGEDYSKGEFAWALAEVNKANSKFDNLQEALENVSYYTSIDFSDGVKMITEKRSHTINNITIKKGFHFENGDRLILVQKGDKSYHAPDNGLRWAIKRANEAWETQKELYLEYDNIKKIVGIKDRSYLVNVQDSYNAGNCEIGTRDWMQSNGFGGRTFVGAQELLPYYVNNERVRNVLALVARKIAA